MSENEKGAAAQISRYTAVAKQFTKLFGPGEIIFFRAPGRINLIGGHTDYNQGYVLPVALDKDIVMAARPRRDSRIRLHNVEKQFHPFMIEINEKIPSAASGDWSNSTRGVAQLLAQQQQRPLLGFDGLVAAAKPQGIPRGAGLSSSSALTVLIAITLAKINNWQPQTASMVQFCSTAEWYVGTRGGIMDQYISLLGQKDHALFLDCRPDHSGQYRTQMVPLPPNYAILVINSSIKHQNTRGHFNRRVAACRLGAALLSDRYRGLQSLRDVEDVPWADLDPFLPDQISVAEALERGIRLDDLPGLTPQVVLKVKTRCRHVWSENRRVLQATAALHLGDIPQVGQLLNEANRSLRDDYEVSCPEVDQLTAIMQDQAEVAGIRLTGAGWGGCLVALVEKTAVSAISHYTQEKYRDATGLLADIFVCQPGPGAGLVKKVTYE